MLELLMKYKADASKVDKFGHTAMYEALRMGHDDCIHIFLDHQVKCVLATVLAWITKSSA